MSYLGYNCWSGLVNLARERVYQDNCSCSKLWRVNGNGKPICAILPGPRGKGVWVCMYKVLRGHVICNVKCVDWFGKPNSDHPPPEVSVGWRRWVSSRGWMWTPGWTKTLCRPFVRLGSTTRGILTLVDHTAECSQTLWRTRRDQEQMQRSRSESSSHSNTETWKTWCSITWISKRCTPTSSWDFAGNRYHLRLVGKRFRQSN